MENRNINFEIKENRILGLLGSNGAGKSTLLMSIFGQPRVRSGQILFCGEDIRKCTRSQDW